MKKDFIVERNGRAFVLFAGLLDEAHSQGLKSIVTSIHQVPNATNEQTAICQATVVLEQNGIERVFTGIGDASPRNVAPAMVTCLLRMAETRAKARALRDAINVGVAAFEELGAEGDPPPTESMPVSRRGAPSGRSATPAPQGACPECRTSGRYHKPGCSRAPQAVAA